MDYKMILLTLAVGFLGSSVFGALLNWPDAGAIFAIAFVGGRILWLLRDKAGEE